MDFDFQKSNSKKRSFLNTLYGFFVFLLVLLQTSSSILYAQSSPLIEQYRESSKELNNFITDARTAEIKSAIERLHAVYDKNPNFFEAIRDIAHGYYMLGDFSAAMLYTQKALKLKQDKNLQALRLQLRMRAMSVEDMRMHKAGAEELKTALTTLLQNTSYNSNVLYTASVYFSIVDDDKNYEKTVGQFRRLYSNDERFTLLLNVYTMLDSIDRAQQSTESKHAFISLQNYSSNPWVLWLLLHYIGVFYVNAEGEIVDDDMRNMFQAYTEQLIESDIVFLRNAGYLMRFNFFFAQSKMQEAQEVAVEYSKHFPLISEAWMRYGVVLYMRKNYGDALQAFTRAEAASSDNSFIDFIYDATLKDALHASYAGAEGLVEKRIGILVDAGKSALRRGDAANATRYARRALYIKPLSAEARLLLSDVFQQQGLLSEAEEELSLLENIEGISSHVTEEIESIRAEIRSKFDVDPVVQELIDKGDFSHIEYDPIPWDVTIKVTSYVENSIETSDILIFDNVNLRYAEDFFTKLLEYALNKFPTIRVVDNTNTTNIARTQRIRLEFSYADINGIFNVRAHLVNENSLEHITTFVESRNGNNRIQEAIYALAQRMHSALPWIIPVLAVRGNTVVLGHGKYKSMSQFILPIFDNGLLGVSVKSPYFTSTGSLIGFAKIENTIANTNIATLQPSIGDVSSVEISAEVSAGQTIFQSKLLPILSKAYAEQTFRLFDMRSRVNAGDVMIIPPAQWVDDEDTEKARGQSLRTILLSTMRIPFW